MPPPPIVDSIPLIACLSEFGQRERADHSIFRVAKGVIGISSVVGKENITIFNPMNPGNQQPPGTVSTSQTGLGVYRTRPAPFSKYLTQIRQSIIPPLAGIGRHKHQHSKSVRRMVHHAMLFPGRSHRPLPFSQNPAFTADPKRALPF